MICLGGCTFLTDLPPPQDLDPDPHQDFELDPAPDPHLNNADPQPWAQLSKDSQEQAVIFIREDVNNFFQVHVDLKIIFLYKMIHGKNILSRR
jgi:hypothetical protein